ncbi:hypothetical protein EDB89DRAFT_1907316 [Lactarius sanguifluus]|nr:hypothetical protein EDB89DRAFT_1907316 [Lactarius sanguifluus]
MGYLKKQWQPAALLSPWLQLPPSTTALLLCCPPPAPSFRGHGLLGRHQGGSDCVKTALVQWGQGSGDRVKTAPVQRGRGGGNHVKTVLVQRGRGGDDHVEMVPVQQGSRRWRPCQDGAGAVGLRW